MTQSCLLRRPRSSPRSFSELSGNLSQLHPNSIPDLSHFNPNSTRSIGESLDNLKIFPVIGDAATVFGKAKFSGYFDAMFLSLRSASLMQSPVADEILKPGALVAVETGKFLVSYTAKEKAELLKKVQIPRPTEVMRIYPLN